MGEIVLKLCVFPEKFYCLKQNGYIAKQCVRTPFLVYWLLIFCFIRKRKVKRNEKKKRITVNECARDNFLYVILKWISNRGSTVFVYISMLQDYFYYHHAPVSRPIDGPLTSKPPGEGKERRDDRVVRKGSRRRRHTFAIEYTRQVAEKERETLVRQPEAIRYFAYIHGYIQTPFTRISGKSMN